MERPVIILGGGIWGSLLAWRLKETLPEIKFRLYEQSSTLGNQVSFVFRETDCTQSVKWLRPLISKSWGQHHIKFPSFEKWITSPVHMIDSRHLHDVVSARLGDDLKLNNTLTPEFALKEGEFVIDARNSCFYKKTGFKKNLSLTVELSEDHNLIAPVVCDGSVTQREIFRNLAYFPLTSNTLIISDIWFSDSQKIDSEEMRKAICESIFSKGWRIHKIIREEMTFSELPLSSPVLREEGRVISLAGLSHDITGCNLPLASVLIERMVSTSFRYGELKELVKDFREECEKDRKYFRHLNRQMIEDKNQKVLEAIYSQSYPLIERFSRGKLTFLDRSRITLGRSHSKLSSLFKLMLPYSFYPRIQYPERPVSKL